MSADLFSDSDTLRHSHRSIRLPYRDGGFLADDLRRLLLPELRPDDALIYGSGFEAQPGLLGELSTRCTLAGNSPEVVVACKQPARFFTALDALGIPYPETTLTPPALTAGWLRKRVGGSGGTHIDTEVTDGGPGFYFQRKHAGDPCSLLFLADGRDVLPVGYNLQLLAPGSGMPYRFGGLASQAPLAPLTKAGLCDAAVKLTREIGLRGLNSLDCLVDVDRWLVLEINPRLSASFGLYDRKRQGAELLRSHLRACAGILEYDMPPEPARTHLIYYAPARVQVPQTICWPAWAEDLPVSGEWIEADAPLCSVSAVGDTAVQALALGRQRLLELEQIINHTSEA